MQARAFRVAATALIALLLALACGEDKDEGGEACPGEAPDNASSCSEYTPGLACSYGSITCTCSGITWNCKQGGSTNTSGSPTGSGGNGFGPGPTG